jgi:hypothetical protein
MAVDAVAQFARRLLQATKTERLKWDLVESSDGPFIAKAGKGSVLVGGGPSATILTVRNAEDEEIETLQADPERPGAWRPWEETLHELWQEARLSALGTTEVIKDLAEEWNLPPDPDDDDIPF